MSKPTSIERKIVFGVAPPDRRGTATIMIGVPAGAWDHMKDGNTHHFDLTRVGLPTQFVLFGAETHDAAMKLIEQGAREAGAAYLDLRREDFGIAPVAETKKG